MNTVGFAHNWNVRIMSFGKENEGEGLLSVGLACL